MYLPFDSVPFVPASEHWQGPFDRVLVRVPKTLALLEEQLIRLQGHLAPGAQVIAGAMIKHLPRAAGDLMEKYIGPVQASLAQKKARLLTATVAERPVARGGPFARRVHRLVLEQQAAVREHVLDPPGVHRPLQVPPGHVVHRAASEAGMRVHEFVGHIIEITSHVRPARQLGTTQK